MSSASSLTLSQALMSRAIQHKEKPFLIKVTTTIGCGSSNKPKIYRVHGSAMGEKEVDATRKNLGWPYKPFLVPEDVKSHWSHHVPEGTTNEAEWNAEFAEYGRKNSEEAVALKSIIGGELPAGWEKALREVDRIHDMRSKEDSGSEHQQKVSLLKKRVIFGLGIGISVAGVVLAGGWIFTVALAAVVFVGAREYFELVRSHGMAVVMTPPPRYVSRVCSVICALMPILTLYFGHIDISVTSAAFVVAMTLLLQRGNPRFAQLSSTMFGLFYCGYLPCFWVKLRCGLAAPALNTGIGGSWPVFLGGQAHWTVGLVATLISISGVIAADTFAFLGGKAFGKTPLTSISPKKTWEGTMAGLAGCIVTTLVLSKVLSWPQSLLSSLAFGFLNFFGSVFGDLTESMIKRDAGVKDSGSLIPGHGGILDRADSYIFTGALAYSFIRAFLRHYGV